MTKKQMELETRFFQMNLNENEIRNENDRLQKVDWPQHLQRLIFFSGWSRRKFNWKTNYKRSVELCTSRRITSRNYKCKRRKKNATERSNCPLESVSPSLQTILQTSVESHRESRHRTRDSRQRTESIEVRTMDGSRLKERLSVGVCLDRSINNYSTTVIFIRTRR